MEELQQLNEKLDLLLKKYTAMQAENTRLDATVMQQQKTISTLNEKLHTLEEGLANSQLSKAVSSGEKGDMRKQLDTVIGEIDKILHTLND